MDLEQYFIESANVKLNFIKENKDKFEEVINIIVNCLKEWNKILIAWNWWSAADSQHFAAELIGRYKTERRSLPAIALTTDTSIITAIWNDYWYDVIFEKQIAWLWSKWDIFIWISTSWNSTNIIKAVQKAKEQWVITIWLLWNTWWMLVDIMDYALVVNSNNTARIQETHLTIYHTICEFIDKEFK